MRITKLIVMALFGIGATAAFIWPETPVSAEGGSPRSLYVQNCARCHGADGKSQTTLGQKLEADDISGGVSTAKTVRLVTNGKGKMPSFKKKLTTAQIAAIAEYVSKL